MTVITDWNSANAAGFGREVQAFGHDLHTRPMFDDAGLIDVLDRYPRDQLGVFTMGLDPVDWRSWRRGVAGDLSGAELLRAAQEGRIWLNLRATNDFLPEYRELANEIFADLEARTPGLKTFKRDVGLLISSPRAHVFYHLDVPPVTLWQLRGRKRMWVYPRTAPFVTDEQLESIVLKETAEQFPYEPAWDEAAHLQVMDPGVAVSWPQNAPHRIVNDDMLNVSLSIEYMTPTALMRANVVYANGLMRRRLGASPRLADRQGPGELAKFGAARAAKALKLHRPTKQPLPASFAVDASRPDFVRVF
jgi:hypothetical protein